MTITIKEISNKYTIIFSFIVTLVILALYMASMFAFAAIFKVDISNPEHNIGFYATSILSKIVFAGLAIFILITFKIQSVMKLTQKGLLKGLLLGWFFILIGILVFIAGFDFSKAGSIERSSWLLLLFVAAVTFLTGVSEEFLCRGFLYNFIFSKFKNVKKAVFISSFIFGIAHLLNLFYAPVISVLVQVVYAFAFGVLFAALYVRSGNIWAIVLLHGFVNFCNDAARVLTPPDVIPESGILQQIPNLILALIAICIGMFLIRKKKCIKTNKRSSIT